MEVNLILEGLKFMVLGMTTVVLFLLLLIAVLKMQAKLVQKYFPEKSSPLSGVTATSASSGKKDDAEVIAVITAAITDFRKN